MRRRTLLASAGATTAALAGCSSFEDIMSTPVPEDLPEVSATYRVDYGLADVRRRILEVERGRISYRATCRTESGDGVDVERSLDREEYVELQRLVVRSRPASWQERYPCRTGCAEDALGYSLVVTVDGEEYHTGVEGFAEPPEPIEALGDRLSELRDQFEGLEDCERPR